MAAELGSPVWLSLVWVIAGIFSIAGALIYAELGAMMPVTGGLYVYFRKMFGDFFAYLYGWSSFAVINTAAVAAIAFVCAEYANHFLHLPRLAPATETSLSLNIPLVGVLYPLENLGVKLLAIGVVLVLTLMNTRSSKASSGFQVVSTVLKIAVLAALVFGIFFSGEGVVSNFFTASEPARGMDLFGGIAIAMTGAFFAYDGWVNITYVAGEIRDPQRNIPRSLLIGVTGIILVYVLVNQAYLLVMPVEEIAGSKLVAAEAIGRAWGAEGEAIIAAMIVICTLGAINGNVMATSRVSFALARDGYFPRAIGRESERGTPTNALWLHAGWISILIFSGSFNMLADMFVFVTWLAYMAGAVGMMKLRRTMKNTARPFKTPGYPWLPILFILFSSFYLIMTVVSDVTNYLNGTQPIINCVLGMLLAALGIPLFFYYKLQKRTVNSEQKT